MDGRIARAARLTEMAGRRAARGDGDGAETMIAAAERELEAAVKAGPGHPYGDPVQDLIVEVAVEEYVSSKGDPDRVKAAELLGMAVEYIVENVEPLLATAVRGNEDMLISMIQARIGRLASMSREAEVTGGGVMVFEGLSQVVAALHAAAVPSGPIDEDMADGYLADADAYVQEAFNSLAVELGTDASRIEAMADGIRESGPELRA